ncbi:MAG TPA: IS1634 family transposase [Propionibacteriaceae bacterium]|nr:IS1634 family transposase [Propionibacteriaceae bacterium]
MRTVRTSSGAVAVQVVWKSSRGSRDIEHLGSAHTDAEVELLKAVATQRIAAGQDQLPLEVGAPQEPSALEITCSRMGRLLDAIAAVYHQLGFDQACGKDVVFEQLVTARMIEPTSKQDAARVLAEAGVRALSYRTVKRRLRGYAKPEWRDRLSGACAATAQLGPSALILYDVTTLWFETDTGDGFREPGFSKERRLDPQITVGLLTDVTGMPLMIDAFEGNRAETKTIIPLVQRFVSAHGIAGVTVVADAGMMSEANLAEIEDAGWSFVIGGKLPEVPYVIKQWRQDNPDLEPANGTTLTQPVIMGPKADQRRRTTIYQYKTDRARRSVHGIQQQVAKAEQAVAGQAAIKRNRFVTLTGGTRTVNRDLEAKARALAGWKPYVTNIVDADPAWVIGAYHHLWRIEHAFRMSKHDLRARPVYHHKHESIDAHLAVVFAALAISHRIEVRTGWTIKKFVRTLRRYRTVKINTGSHTLTAEDPLPDDVRQALADIHQGAH